jgi:hypothetical protein
MQETGARSNIGQQKGKIGGPRKFAKFFRDKAPLVAQLLLARSGRSCAKITIRARQWSERATLYVAPTFHNA